MGSRLLTVIFLANVIFSLFFFYKRADVIIMNIIVLMFDSKISYVLEGKLLFFFNIIIFLESKSLDSIASVV